MCCTKMRTTVLTPVRILVVSSSRFAFYNHPCINTDIKLHNTIKALWAVNQLKAISWQTDSKMLFFTDAVLKRREVYGLNAVLYVRLVVGQVGSCAF